MRVTPFVKCCGITTLVDVQSVVALGFHYAGCIRVPNTPRYVSADFLKEASQYTVGGSTQLVGVYQGATLAEIMEDSRNTPGLKVVQLHGDEPVEFVQSLREILPNGVALWKVFSLLNPPDDETIVAYAPYVEAILLDLPKGIPTPFHWEEQPPNKEIQQAIERIRHHGLKGFLAGKLTPTLVDGVLAGYHPDGLDVASGVETVPGQKDYALMQAFIHQAL
jgi:phosphoribosylanthranilate isomerase